MTSAVERKCFNLHKIMTPWDGKPCSIRGTFKCWLVAYTETYSDGTSRNKTREFDTLTKAKRFRKEERI